MDIEDFKTKVHEIEFEIRKIQDPEGNASSIPDGIVDVDEYLNAPIKIMWILKEANSPNDEEGWCINDALRGWIKTDFGVRKGWVNTFNPIIYTTNGIFTNRSWEEIEHTYQNPNLIDDLKKIAFVNVKKIPGGATANWEKLVRAYQEHKNILLKQIEVYNPDIMICGNTFGLIKEDLDLSEMKKVIAYPIHFYQSTKRLIVDAYHPNNRVKGLSQEHYCDSIIKAVNEWRKSKEE